MLIVNTTYNVSESVVEEWKEWVRTEYIPQVITPGLLVQPRFHHLLVENEPGNQSYALQFEVQDINTLKLWFDKYSTEIKKNQSEKFQEKVLGFTTVMEVLDFE
jgi:hypothetical protein